MIRFIVYRDGFGFVIFFFFGGMWGEVFGCRNIEIISLKSSVFVEFIGMVSS